MNLNLQEDCRTLEEFHPDPLGYHRMHCAFAHQFLPQYVHQNPHGFFSYLYNQQLPGGVMDPTTFIQSRWSMFTDMIGGPAPGPKGPFPSDLVFRRVTDLSMSIQEVNDQASALVAMPRCYRPPEAYFVCIVLDAIAAHVGSWPHDVPARVFTLEFGSTQQPAGVICEWTAAGQHMNFGQGVPTDRESFLQAVSEVLTHHRLPVPDITGLPHQEKEPWWKAVITLLNKRIY